MSQIEGAGDVQQESMHDQKEYRFIVDRDITDNAIQGIFLTI